MESIHVVTSWLFLDHKFSKKAQFKFVYNFCEMIKVRHYLHVPHFFKLKRNIRKILKPACIFYKKIFSAGLFCEFLKNTYFVEHLRRTASEVVPKTSAKLAEK